MYRATSITTYIPLEETEYKEYLINHWMNLAKIIQKGTVSQQVLGTCSEFNQHLYFFHFFRPELIYLVIESILLSNLWFTFLNLLTDFILYEVRFSWKFENSLMQAPVIKSDLDYRYREAEGLNWELSWFTSKAPLQCISNTRGITLYSIEIQQQINLDERAHKRLGLNVNILSWFSK